MAGEYLSEEELSRRLQRVEETHDLLQYQSAGWCIWPMLRFPVSRAMQTLPLDRGTADRLSKRDLATLGLIDLARFVLRGRSRIAIKTYASYHSDREQGAKKDVFFDDLIPRLGSVCKIEVVNGRKFIDGVPYARPRDFTTSAIGLLSDRLTRYFPDRTLEPAARMISACLVSEFGVEQFTPEFIVRSISAFHWNRRLYRALLARVRPSELLLAEVGDYPITAAARELGIPVIEFQHGISHRHYPANSWTRYALPYKTRMALPDRVFLFGRHWQEELEALGFWGEELRTVGSLRVDAYRQLPTAREPGVCTIVVTLQGTDTERVLAYFREFVRAANGRVRYRLVFKMHPVYQTTEQLFRDAFAGESSVEIVSGAELPNTLQLLKRANLHVSIFSACHYEALALGVPTVVLPLDGAENVAALVRAGHAVVAQSPEDLVSIAEQMETLAVPDEVGEEYFANNALEAIVTGIDTLRSRSAA